MDCQSGCSKGQRLSAGHDQAWRFSSTCVLLRKDIFSVDEVLERLHQRENQALVPQSPKSGQGVVVVVVVTYGMGIVRERMGRVHTH